MFGWVLAAVLGSLVTGGIIFAAAGRLDLPYIWAYLVLKVILGVVGTLVAGVDLLRERMKPGPGGRPDMAIYLGIPLWLTHLILSGLDIGRLHWSDVIPGWLRVLGLIGIVTSSAIVIWAMGVNKYFSSVVRLQSDRGQRVISDGPYRLVRHPGYAAMLLYIPSSILALGSLIGGIPMALWIIPLRSRVLTEDRFLKERLPGYDDYSQRVRYRLLPGVW